MKHSKFLFIPLLFVLSSCVSLSQNTPGGPIVNPGTDSSNETEKLDFFQDGILGDELPQEKLTVASFSWKNDEEKASLKYDTSDALLNDTLGNKEAISNFELAEVWKGVKAIKLDYNTSMDNFLKINLKSEFKVRYIKINCSPAYYNTPNYAGDETKPWIFHSKDSAINVNDSKYVKLVSKQVVPENSAETNEKPYAEKYDVTFDLGQETTQFCIKSRLYSTVINSIELYK